MSKPFPRAVMAASSWIRARDRAGSLTHLLATGVLRLVRLISRPAASCLYPPFALILDAGVAMRRIHGISLQQLGHRRSAFGWRSQQCASGNLIMDLSREQLSAPVAVTLLIGGAGNGRRGDRLAAAAVGDTSRCSYWLFGQFIPASSGIPARLLISFFGR